MFTEYVGNETLTIPDKDFNGFPKTVFHIAGRDILGDEGLLLEAKLKRMG
jgi:hypothetical protein